AAGRTPVRVPLEDAERPDGPRPSRQVFSATGEEQESEEGAEAEGWRRFRPDVLMRGRKERNRRQDEAEGWIRLAIARAEEGIISTHVNNAITFAALLEHHMPLERAVDEYNNALRLTGPRAQAVHQRAMARLAEAHLPSARAPARSPSPGPGRGAGDARPAAPAARPGLDRPHIGAVDSRARFGLIFKAAPVRPSSRSAGAARNARRPVPWPAPAPLRPRQPAAGRGDRGAHGNATRRRDDRALPRWRDFRQDQPERAWPGR